MPDITRATRPEWIWPRADSHIVLGAPGTRDVLKTFVEPGGSFSPGLGTCGVSVWVWLPTEQRLVAPERLPREAIRDRLLGGTLPIQRSRWRAGPFELDLRLGVEPAPDAWQVLNLLSCQVANRSHEPATGRLLLVVRSFGPAGGPVRSLAVTPGRTGLQVNQAAAVVAGQAADQAGCVSLASDGLDLSVPLLKGEFPSGPEAADPDGWCSGYLAYDLSVDAGGEWHGSWYLPVPAATMPPAEVTARTVAPARHRLDWLADQWRQRLHRVELQVPDQRLAEAFHASVAHLLMAFCGDEPRIAPVSYPLPWLRDTVYIVNALDKAGLHRWSRAAVDHLARHPWAGGFGPEADAPGELLWCLAEHYRYQPDAAWLEHVYPLVRERVGQLHAMRRCTAPMRGPVGAILPRTQFDIDQDLVCEAARDGLIIGRMDGHRPLIWVNSFALAGLRGAVALAGAVGAEDEAAAWRTEAEQLEEALRGLQGVFGANERDVACALWPTGAFGAQEPWIHEAFETYWFRHRYDERGRYHLEPRWRYFELALAHNLLRLGMRERTLLTIEQFLRTQDAPGLYGWHEGDATGDPCGLWRGIRGWWPTSRIVPHGWCGAEMALLLRDLFVYEEDDAVVIGAGVRAEWLATDDVVGIAEAPTHFGRLTWRLEPAGPNALALSIHAHGVPPGGYRIRLPFGPSATVEVDGVGIREDSGDWVVRDGREDLTVQITRP